jgi:glycerol-1-phosphate dehydrogenase [NAD(P)+]
MARWPDAVLIDLTTIADAPLEMILAGFGDLMAMGTAPADWYLAGALGLDDTYHPALAALGTAKLRVMLRHASGLRSRSPESLDPLCRALAFNGIIGGLVGHSAPASGAEHVISHVIDMTHVQSGRPCALHGAQVGAASVLHAVIWDRVLAGFDPGSVDVTRSFPDAGEMETRVMSVFAALDPSGRIGTECWQDYSRKLARWHASRGEVEGFLHDWQRHRAALRRVVLPAEELAGALVAAGAPARLEELRPPTGRAEARWTLQHCQLMRNRFTILDLVDLLGWQTETLVDSVLEQADSIPAVSS